MFKRYKHIELFAGCGGMSLGLHAAGFELFFANELSPMAAETFAYNILNEDLRNYNEAHKTVWLKSDYERGDLRRLRENPFTIQDDQFSDIANIDNLENRLIVGDINALNKFLLDNPKIANNLRSSQVDLVSGGPPCQSFSLAGRREKNNNKNKLPWAFAEFVNIIQPKLVLLENVSGILRAFTENGRKYYAWFEVAKAFGLIGYIPICIHLNAKNYGIPQNRPRFIMLAIRADLAKKLQKDKVLEGSYKLLERLGQQGETITIHDIPEYQYFELGSRKHAKLFFESMLLPTPTLVDEDEYISVKQGIDGLKNKPDGYKFVVDPQNAYEIKLERTFNYYNFRKLVHVKNHNRRSHSEKILNRFKLLRIFEEFKNGEKNKLFTAVRTGVISGLDESLLKDITHKLNQNNFNGNIEDIFKHYQSRKHTQRVLKATLPAPAALSIPDDICHYDPSVNRTLTVREMARIQSFPDWFEFRSKDTTGGTNRRFEVPNYTQVGNAVPPLLAKEIGRWISVILKHLGHGV